MQSSEVLSYEANVGDLPFLTLERKVLWRLQNTLWKNQHKISHNSVETCSVISKCSTAGETRDCLWSTLVIFITVQSIFSAFRLVWTCSEDRKGLNWWRQSQLDLRAVFTPIEPLMLLVQTWTFLPYPLSWNHFTKPTFTSAFLFSVHVGAGSRNLYIRGFLFEYVSWRVNWFFLLLRVK